MAWIFISDELIFKQPTHFPLIKIYLKNLNPQGIFRFSFTKLPKQKHSSRTNERYLPFTALALDLDRSAWDFSCPLSDTWSDQLTVTLAEDKLFRLPVDDVRMLLGSDCRDMRSVVSHIGERARFPGVVNRLANRDLGRCGDCTDVLLSVDFPISRLAIL